MARILAPRAEYIYLREQFVAGIHAYKEITKERKMFVNTEHVFVFERSTSRRRLDGRDVKFPVGISKEEKLKSWYARIPF